jgi:hypothetical protein
MGVLSRQGDWSGKGMMQTVDFTVEWLQVQQTVGVVEAEFADKNAEGCVQEAFVKGRYGCVEAVEGVVVVASFEVVEKD